VSLSIIIPCKNEEKTILKTFLKLKKKIKFKIKKFEIILIDDFSKDNTLGILKKISKQSKNIKVIKNKYKGLGGAINLGIKFSKNKYIAIMMADLSDDPYDLIRYYKEISNNDLDAVFGSRFMRQSKVVEYPIKKLIYNRIFNIFVKLIFLSKYNDFTNAFKIYKKNTLIDLKPLVSENFNIFLELPLKTINRKKKIKIIPINWRNRKIGSSKFKVNELSSKYFFTLIYCFFEKILLK
jgi:dolichol-phosphate mannosyltransferase